MGHASRREFLQMSGRTVAALAGAAGGAGGQGAPPDLVREGDRWLLRNAASGDALPLTASCPLFDFGEFHLGGREAGDGSWERDGASWRASWSLRGPLSATARVRLVPDPPAGVLRRHVILAVDRETPVLRSVVLDDLEAPGPPVLHRPGLQSHPVLLPTFFLGVEYPVATTRVDGRRIVLSHAPGRRLRAREEFHTRPAVYGACTPGRSREAFEAYIASLRPRPAGMHFNYNSWWTSPVPYTEQDILGLIRAFREKLHAPYGAAPDTFCIDMGWAKNTTLWEIDRSLFPGGFVGVAEACRDIGSRPGLWISPSGVYGQALDLAWARQAGYEADTKACLGGHRYQAAFRRSLVAIGATYGLGHVKLDGYALTCDSKDHGHEPGELSAEPIAEGMLGALTALREAEPDIWMEPTCFGFDPSPWWLPHCNSVIGAFGDDAPNGRVPCPTYRESYTTGRDYFNLKGARDIQVPVAAQEVLGVVHQTAEPLQNDAIVTVMRGHQFVPLYVNPGHMTPRRWEFLAALMKWARANQAVLAETRPVLFHSWREAGGGPGLFEESRAPREPYGYCHWKDGRGLVCLRNPWIEPATVSLAREAGLGVPAEAGPLTARSIYPDAHTLAEALGPGDALTVALRPYETTVVELGPRAAPLPPRRGEAAGPVARLATAAARAVFADAGPPFGPDYTRRPMEPGPHLRVTLRGGVEPRGRGVHVLLLLVEGPGPIVEPLVAASVDGRAVEARLSSSEGGWRATGAPPPEHWLWVAVPLPSRRAQVQVEVTLGGPEDTLAAWLAVREEIPWRPLQRVDGTALPPPEERYLSAVRVADALRVADRMPEVRAEAPVERIDGIYLDALEPVSVAQGWGTLQRNRSVWEKPMMVGGRRFLRGLGTHAPSRIGYALDGRWRRFRAWAGADQATAPTIGMEVRLDGRSVWKSGPLTRDSAAQRVEVDVAGARRLELIVDDGGNGLAGDHADWADAMLLR